MLTKIDISSSDIQIHYFCFFNVATEENLRLKNVLFLLQSSFFFSFSCMCLMGTFKKTEYNPSCKVFTEVFLIARIPHFTVLIHFRQRENEILWPLW